MTVIEVDFVKNKAHGSSACDLPLSFHVQQSNTGINQIEEEKNVLVILVVLFPNCHSGPHGMRLVWFQDRPDHRPVCLSQGHTGTQSVTGARDKSRWDIKRTGTGHIGTRQSWGEWFQTNPYQIAMVIMTRRLNAKFLPRDFVL